MKISIITATYNSAATVRDTLVSIREQDYHTIEHIIVDGGSTDNTLDIVAAFPHVAKVVSEKDQGIYDAMNKGIGLATGEVIGILNSDDMYIDSKVISLVAAAFRDVAMQITYADLQYIHQTDTSRIVRIWKTGNFSKRKFYYGWMPPHPTLFVRRNVYEQIGLFNLSMRSSADYELMLRAFLKHQITAHYIPQIIVKMRAGGISNASVKNRIRANREDRQAWKMNGLQPYFFTLYIKPIRKVSQFLIK